MRSPEFWRRVRAVIAVLHSIASFVRQPDSEPTPSWDDIRERVRKLSATVDLVELELEAARRDQLEADVERLRRDLQRARDTIAIIYVGSRGRRADGTVDVDAIIDGVTSVPFDEDR